MDSRQATLLDQTIRPHLPLEYPEYPRKSELGWIPENAAMVPGAHLVYFPSHETELQLSPDGYHADEAPPDPFCQRVWAGGLIKLNTANPLRVSSLSSQTKYVSNVTIKERMGADPLILVQLALEMDNQHGRSVTEYRNLAYMKPVELKRKIVRHNRDPDFSHVLTPTEIMLFRYSALSWNSHRIHYDALYAQNVEHHPGLLVHGPLTCTLLLQLLQTHMPAGMGLQSFDYRAVSPMYCQQKVTLNGRWMPDHSRSKTTDGTLLCELWATNNNGGLAMKGVATIVPLNAV
ncbi:hypothetical protein IWW36_000055 [Coemansia brasiliensis]|uniref:Uncharacterized protein n=1 Tax=Coemansia brasiliensis TaxID=2650707 RepID=A0A9W8IKF2_9FUNG|nr:hypothetical protein IWW36_000055 [Coemansia brasiliensis]